MHWYAAAVGVNAMRCNPNVTAAPVPIEGTTGSTGNCALLAFSVTLGVASIVAGNRI
jgi:hypothetical protein